MHLLYSRCIYMVSVIFTSQGFTVYSASLVYPDSCNEISILSRSKYATDKQESLYIFKLKIDEQYTHQKENWCDVPVD